MVHQIIKSFIDSAVKVDYMYEAENFSFTIDPEKSCFIFTNEQASIFGREAFTKRKAAALFMWYMNSNVNDTSICDIIPFYKRAMNKQQPIFNSNYGVYFFDRGGMAHCIEKLAKDRNTRHAIVMINDNKTMFSNDIDKLCTNSVMFRIRDNKLNMSVNMRSNHFINMMPFDVFCFSMFYSLLFNTLKAHYYPKLSIGTYYHEASSMHIDVEQMRMLKTLVNATHNVYLEFDFGSPMWTEKLNKKLGKWLNRI